MFPKQRSHKPDPFIVLLLIVGIGVSVSVAYQLRMYNSDRFFNMRSAQNIATFPWATDQISVTISDFRQH